LGERTGEREQEGRKGRKWTKKGRKLVREEGEDERVHLARQKPPKRNLDYFGAYAVCTHPLPIATKFGIRG